MAPHFFQCYCWSSECDVLINVNAITTIHRKRDGKLKVILGTDCVTLARADEIEALFELLGVRLDVEVPASGE